MKRRDLLKYLLAAPAAAAIPAAMAAPRDFDTATMTARMHYAPSRLHEADLPGHMGGDFSIEALRYEHQWLPNTCICGRCGVSEQDLEEGLAPKFCLGIQGSGKAAFGRAL